MIAVLEPGNLYLTELGYLFLLVYNSISEKLSEKQLERSLNGEFVWLLRSGNSAFTPFCGLVEPQFEAYFRLFGQSLSDSR
jgi:hypothetical protein